MFCLCGVHGACNGWHTHLAEVGLGGDLSVTPWVGFILNILICPNGAAAFSMQSNSMNLKRPPRLGVMSLLELIEGFLSFPWECRALACKIYKHCIFPRKRGNSGFECYLFSAYDSLDNCDRWWLELQYLPQHFCGCRCSSCDAVASTGHLVFLTAISMPFHGIAFPEEAFSLIWKLLSQCQLTTSWSLTWTWY